MKDNHTVARATRMEYDSLTGELYLVFKVIDEDFKKRVRENWDDDVQLEVLGKELVEPRS